MRPLVFLLSFPLLAAPATLINSPLSDLKYSGSSSAGTVRTVDVQGQSFSQALRLTTLSAPANEWDVRVRAKGTVAVLKGDSVVAEFYMRCISPENGTCMLRFNVERGNSPYTKSVSIPYAAGPAWRKVRMLFTFAEDYADANYYMDFWMGGQVQAVELGGVSVVNYGQNVKPADVGVDPLYEGAAADAAWRTEALARIDQIRKGAVIVSIYDQNRRPVPGASVHVKMLRHSFGWGTAVDGATLFQTGADSDRYRQTIQENFNLAVLENDLKWPQWESNRTRPLNAITWLHTHGIPRVRGHNLIWPSWGNLPSDLKNLANDPAALRKRINDHFQDQVPAVAGLVSDWDVLNEPYTNTDVQKILGDSEMAAWFKLAKQYDSSARLFVNDYSIIESNGADVAHINGYLKAIRAIQAGGGPLEGIGIQGHFGSPTPPGQMLQILDQFAAFGLPIEITEYDYNTTDEALQAKFFRDLLITCYSHPSVSNFLMWGFWEGRHWLPAGAMIRKDWSTRPSYDVWREMVYKTWWTDEKRETPYHGTVQLRAFLGDYSVDVTYGDKTVSVPLSLTKTGAHLEVTLPIAITPVRPPRVR